MNRLPPSLLYLTIYNPTLQPSGPIDDDNEDAEEQAHILFYTSKERAVSRDRMLRQIGLAKALINFAEVFDPDSTCDNVHSQSRRMVMLSPELNFWIHAGIDVARSSRTVDTKAKSKSKSKLVDTGKAPDSAPVYDYDDGSVHDGAIRAHLLQGYERFKLTHGSFTSILSTLGQQALELQLERFWTVWAWSWNLEEPSPFGENFGPLLHPHYSSLIPIIDDFSMNLPRAITPMVLTRHYIIPSERYIEGRYSQALAAHLSAMIPLVPDPSRSSDTLNTLASSVDTIKGKYAPNSNSRGQSSQDGGVNFLPNMPTINMNMDMRKWNWPGYLTFGKGSSSKNALEKDPKDKTEQPPAEATTSAPRTELRQVEVDFNAEALEDAISSDSMSILSKDRYGQTNTAEDAHVESSSPKSEHGSTSDDGDSVTGELSLDSSSPVSPLLFSELTEETPPPSPPPIPEFSTIQLYAAPSNDPTATRKVTINYLIKNTLMLALITRRNGTDEDQGAADIQAVAERCTKLFDDLESCTDDINIKSISESIPSATKILQPRDRYAISTGQFSHSSPSFTSNSAHLFNAKAILDKDSEILEVFSRGQNPQYWHIAKRGLGKSTVEKQASGPSSDGEVFMEVFRKETSLTDVDNVLTGVVKKSGLVESAPASR
ncbi:hypothetical protein HYPSUDRAFT_34294 [Hypholoma sublateritium FD-334 SS-4]|uniref:CCZ1/INTU/HSP4 first Longin domain-containing protein n=1 Tax=Hypholoma sublateritium (strain FD-334 SS-4) TaxID=945553 RepID=A0A0D2PHQ2_HYPSF|nr:hypothetical protein HYPSUDRAFT_34294 [Hypholoma sublateritium FD-334 SS-4]